jgi:putative SOS response-associated peptidase YedK
MCNHYRNIPEHIQTWAEYVGWDKPYGPFDEAEADVWPRRKALVARQVDGQTIPDVMTWGVPLSLPGKRPGTSVTKYITNVRNLHSLFWHSMLAQPAQRCLVPFTEFAEPKPNSGRDEIWFRVSDTKTSAFAGIWRGTDKGSVFAFLTCEPNPMIKPFHPKAMPVILHPDDYARWLDGEDAAGFATPFPSQLMQRMDEPS